MNADFDRTYAQLERGVKALAETTGIEFTFGYIGNCQLPRYDDRLWFVFAPHPGRVGKDTDRIGGHRTEELHHLVREVRGALQLARVQARAF